MGTGLAGRMETARGTVFRLLDPTRRETLGERAVKAGLVALILLNVAAVILETVRSLGDRFGEAFARFEAFSVVVFTVEYALRVWTCTLDPRYRGPLAGRLRYVASPMALIDLAAIVPAFLPREVFVDLRYARAVRLVRMFRALKTARYSRSVQTFTNVFRERQSDLGLIAWLLLLMLILSSSSIYYAEHEAQPQTFSSIPASMWWSIVTLTTVGYGDVYPVTPAGRVLGALIALLGIGFFALPAGILASAFAEEMRRARTARRRECPNCGATVPD